MKDSRKIEAMRVGGRILSDVLRQLTQAALPGVTELELDMLAEKLIRERGGEPGFKKVSGYKNTLCVSVNDVVVHGIPGKRELRAGDIIGIDCGVYYGGYHTDMAETVLVRSVKQEARNQKDKEIEEFLKVGKEAMMAGIKQAKVGNRVGNISAAMQKIIEAGGYSVVRNLVGHGVGRELHEKPEIPGYLDRPIEKTPLLKKGMTIAIEAIYNQGSPEVSYNRHDGWTISTADGLLSGMFERTVLVDAQAEFLTPTI